jgi:ribosomal protein S18 acetylase RimI-like enzyme
VPEVRPLEHELERPAAEVLAAAFIDDPGWSAVGPRSRSRRLKMLERFFRGHMGVARRWGGPIYGAFDNGGPVGALIAFEEERFPPPPQSMLMEAPGMLAAGPGTTIRALRGQATLAAGHPEEPHAFVSMLGVHPDSQRSGAGRALLGQVLAEADEREVPVYLDTANPDNLPYYRSFGFELTGQGDLPRGATIWYLLRPIGARYARS